MKVIVAIDDSPYSKELVDSIIKRPWPRGIEFKILTVLEPLCVSCNENGVDEFSTTITAINERRRKGAERMCERICHKLESSIHGARAHYEIKEGLPRVEIIDTAIDWMSDRILIGAHGRDVCPHSLLGSVSRAVASHAPCSVEIVRPPMHFAELAQSS